MKVIIMRGLPGSGKSTLAKTFTGNCVIVSADAYPGLYNMAGEFQLELIGPAHEACLAKFLELCQNPNNVEFLIVDNTNLCAWEISPYWRLAKLFKHQVSIIQVNAAPSVAFGRQLHKVPRDRYDLMVAKFFGEMIPWPIEIRET